MLYNGTELDLPYFTFLNIYFLLRFGLANAVNNY